MKISVLKDVLKKNQNQIQIQYALNQSSCCFY